MTESSEQNVLGVWVVKRRVYDVVCIYVKIQTLAT